MISYFLQFSISSISFWVVKINVPQVNAYPIMSLLVDFLLENASSTEHVLWNWAMAHPDFISISRYRFCLTLWTLELFFFLDLRRSFVKPLLINSLAMWVWQGLGLLCLWLQGDLHWLRGCCYVAWMTLTELSPILCSKNLLTTVVCVFAICIFLKADHN